MDSTDLPPPGELYEQLSARLRGKGGAITAREANFLLECTALYLTQSALLGTRNQQILIVSGSASLQVGTQLPIHMTAGDILNVSTIVKPA